MLALDAVSGDELLLKVCHLGMDVLDTPRFQALRAYPQHGGLSRYQHVLSVAWFALYLAGLLHWKTDERSLVRGALLHDYFLYDWHDPGALRVHHATGHAREALETAEKEFSLNDTEREIILRHMFPINLKPPTCREAWLVTLADKLSALLETIRLPMALRVSERCGQVVRTEDP